MFNDIQRDTASLPMRDKKGMSDTQRFGSAHFGGLNVLYADGSVRWVKRSVFDMPLSLCPSISPSCNGAQDQIWAALDAAP